jgi:hypothetical protein
MGTVRAYLQQISYVPDGEPLSTTKQDPAFTFDREGGHPSAAQPRVKLHVLPLLPVSMTRVRDREPVVYHAPAVGQQSPLGTSGTKRR